MTIPRSDDLSTDLLEDFRLDAAEQFPRCEQLLIELEHYPDDEPRLRELFRLVHTLKGNLGYVGLNHLMPLPQAMEDVLDALRERRIDFDSLLGDILLLNLDHLRELIREALGGGAARINPTQMLALSEALHNLRSLRVAIRREVHVHDHSCYYASNKGQATHDERRGQLTRTRANRLCRCLRIWIALQDALDGIERLAM